MALVREHFRPEFLNRVDEIIMFNPLATEQLMKIVDIQLKEVEKQLADRKITITVSDDAKQMLFADDLNRAYGARPLKRSIQRLIQNPLAMKILDGEVLHGDHVTVEMGKGSELEFKVSRQA